MKTLSCLLYVPTVITVDTLKTERQEEQRQRRRYGNRIRGWNNMIAGFEDGIFLELRNLRQPLKS